MCTLQKYQQNLIPFPFHVEEMQSPQLRIKILTQDFSRTFCYVVQMNNFRILRQLPSIVTHHLLIVDFPDLFTRQCLVKYVLIQVLFKSAWACSSSSVQTRQLCV